MSESLCGGNLEYFRCWDIVKCIVEISKSYAHWDIDNPEISNFYAA